MVFGKREKLMLNYEVWCSRLNFAWRSGRNMVMF